MIRLVAAVVIGIVAWIALATTLNLGLRLGWPAYAGVEAAMTFTVPMLLARLAVGALASAGAGLAAALVARRPAAPLAVSAVLVLFFLPVHYGLWATFPAWYHLAFFASLLALPWLGAKPAMAEGSGSRTHPAARGAAHRV